MAGDIIRPSALPSRTDPVASEVVPSDNGSVVGGVTWAAGVAAGRPLANQAEAEAGVNATKAMTPLTTKQAIVAQGDVRFASVAQGAKADTAVQSVVAGANITVDNTDPQNPVVTGAAVTDGDKGDVTVSGSGAVWGVNAGSIDAAKITDDPLGWDAIAAKLRILEKSDQAIWFNANDGDDDLGDGTLANPYQSFDRAKQDVSILCMGRTTIWGGGTVTTATRPALAMIRAALFYIDQLVVGQRTDAPGGELIGGFVVKHEPTYPALILQCDASYPRGFYVTGNVGRVGFQNFKILPVESAGVAHNGNRVHTNNIEVDGGGVANFGFVTEADGHMENLNSIIYGVGKAGLAYSGTTLQFSLSTQIYDCFEHALYGAGGDISVTDGADIVGNIFSANGSAVVIGGATTVLSGNIEVRADSSYAGSAYSHTSGTFTNYGSVDLAAVGYNGRFIQYAGSHRFSGVNSYVAPATASAVSEPYTIFGGTGYVDTASDIVALGGTIINSAGEKITSGKPKGHIFGLTLVNSGTDPTNDIVIAAGVCRDTADSVDMVLPAARTKQLDAAWAAGNNAGGRDTGAIADGTWHVFLIRNPTTQGVDALFSQSPTAPTMPSGYTQKRRIGSIIRASGAIVAFTQTEDRFLLSVPVVNYDAAPNSASAITVTLTSLPSGVGVTALLHGHMLDTSATAARAALLTSFGQADTAPTSGGLGQFQTTGASGSVFSACGGLEVPTNNLRQVRARISVADTDVFLRIVAEGWLDTRGRLD